MTNPQAPGKPPLTPIPTSATQLSERGAQFIREQEGFRANAYRDAAGHWTIGYGHKIIPGDGLNNRSVITAEQARQLFTQDVSRFANAVRAMVRVPLSQGQFDALVSLAYNIGETALRNSTLLRALNAGNIAEAAAQFSRWVYAGGRRLSGLAARRIAETAMFNGALV